MFKRKNIPAAQLADIYQHLSDLLEAKVSMADAMECISIDIESERVRNILNAMATDIRSGANPYEVLADRSAAYGLTAVRMINAANDNSIIDILRTLNLRNEHHAVARLAWRQLRWTIWTHVVFLLFISTVASIYVLPTMSELFSSFGADLPTITKLVISAGDNLWIVLNLGVIAYVIYLLRGRIPYMQKFFATLGLMLPVSGSLLRMIAGSQFIVALTTLRAAQVPLVEALQVAVDSIENIVLRKQYAALVNEVATGKRFPDALRSIRVVPRRMVQAMEVADRTGRLDTGLETTVNAYEERVMARVMALQGRFRFAAILLIGLVVLVLALAFYMPIFKLSSVL